MGAPRGMDEQQLPQSPPQSPPPSSSGTTKRDEEEEAAAAGPLSKGEPSNFFGKHRMAAAVSHLHIQIDMIQEELEELETLGKSSIVCKELISTVETIPDPLLPMSKGPADIGWERWFQGVQSSSRILKRWI